MPRSYGDYAAAFVAALLVLCILIFSITMNSTTSVSAVEARGVGVYWDSNCSNRVSSIDWGTLNPGSVKNVAVYIRNEEEGPMYLIMSTRNWSPPNTSEYLNLGWNYTEGWRMNPGEALQITLTLSVSRYIQGISSFSFDILVAGSDSLVSSGSTIFYYDGQWMTGWLHWGKATYDAPAVGAACVDPGPYPYEFNISEPSHAHLEIRHQLYSPNSEENYLTIYLDGVPVLEANTTGLDWYPGGDGIELIDLGTLPAGTHFINMSATFGDYYAMDWFKVLGPVYDVAVVNVVPANTEVYTTWTIPLNITVTVLNNGTERADFNVAAYYNDTLIETPQTVTDLGVGMQENLTFSWNLTSVAHGFYTIRANATLLEFPDINPGNDGKDVTVKVKWPGDCDGSGGYVDLADLIIFSNTWSLRPGDPGYDPRADFDGSGGYVDVADLIIFINYWSTAP